MRTKEWWLVVSALALLPACGGGGDLVPHPDAAPGKDTVADTGTDGAQGLWDTAPDLALDFPAIEANHVDQASSGEVSGGDLPAVVDSASDVQGEAGKLDVAAADAPADTAGEAGPPPSYVCRDDSDCCIKVDTCMAKAYLYSKAPGASPGPSILLVTDPGQCLRCMTPGVQVRCEKGECVGQSMSGRTDLAKDHCGTIGSPDGGSSLDFYYEPAYAGGQQTVWGC